jgi:hypothetical protein
MPEVQLSLLVFGLFMDFEGVGVRNSFKTSNITGGGRDDYRQTAMPGN